MIIMRNINSNLGLCNGVRAVVVHGSKRVLDVLVISGKCSGERFYLPRIPMSSEANALPFRLSRRQFPVKLAWGMSINKAQGQSLERVGVLLEESVFAHGQLYVALSRARSFGAVRVVVRDTQRQGHQPGSAEIPAGVYTQNIVYKDILLTDMLPAPTGSMTQVPVTANEDASDAEMDATVAPRSPGAAAAVEAAGLLEEIPHTVDAAEVLDTCRPDAFPDVSDAPDPEARGGEAESDSGDSVSLELSGSDSDDGLWEHQPGEALSWHAPHHPTAPLPPFLGLRMAEPAPWYNTALSGCTSLAGTQVGATCGLFAVNHALASASSLGLPAAPPFPVGAFEANALAAALGDAAANLMQPGGANYDWAVLQRNLELAGMTSHPMLPETLQTRLPEPFANFFDAAASYVAAAYVLRTPQAGGHWIALVHPTTVGMVCDDGLAAVLCDSLLPAPFLLSLPETEDLLIACALEGVRPDAGFGHNLEWGCFLVTGPAAPHS